MHGVVGQMSRCLLSGFGCDEAESRSECGLVESRDVGLSACKKNGWGSWTSVVGSLQEERCGLRSLFLGLMRIKRGDRPWKMFPETKRVGVP